MQAGHVGGGGGGDRVEPAVHPRELDALRGEMREGFRSVRDDIRFVQQTLWGVIAVLVGSVAAILVKVWH
jgi:hypothetical protein